jgi:hypothetical protein
MNSSDSAFDRNIAASIATIPATDFSAAAVERRSRSARPRPDGVGP